MSEQVGQETTGLQTLLGSSMMLRLGQADTPGGKLVLVIIDHAGGRTVGAMPAESARSWADDLNKVADDVSGPTLQIARSIPDEMQSNGSTR